MIRPLIILLVVIFILLLGVMPLMGLESPWISDVFFYWYTWDYQKELGSWLGGVYYIPLVGYYDSTRYEDNLKQLWLASEWGITHHFMDYWAFDWKANTGEPRHSLLVRAAEELQKKGYDCWMSYYQDGWDFKMKEFKANIEPPRDVYLWLQHYAKSPAWPKLNGHPFQMVYGRNGAPEVTIDHGGFQKYLKGKYGSIEELNRTWGTDFKGFEEIKMDFSRGWQRVEAINYQYIIWEKAWDQMNKEINKKFGFPGMKASFDVHYGPFRGWSYCKFAKLFGGPHSYGGIFGQPQDMDVERFIQSIVAKYYNTVFFDHFKNNYCDWNTIGRIPGTEYPPEPFHFDRFWVGDLMRYNEAILHLSWNEWWEGSNLEPTLEYGKKFCEKNLFYSTIMKEFFGSLKDFARGARVAVILNDWNFMYGSRHPEDLYNTIQALRALDVKFDLIPDDFITMDKLNNFKVVIAPACEVGFGFNEKGEPIFEVLKNWAEKGKGKRLLVSTFPEVIQYLGLQKGAPKVPKPVEKGPDMNLFVDVGEEGDDRYLIDGCSQREDWGQLPPEKFGATKGRLTVRWTPASGNITTFSLPLSPHRDHILRLQGSAIWENRVEVLLDGVKVGEITVIPQIQEYELAIPANLVGDRTLAELQLIYDKMHIPGEIEPGRFGGESRVCNLGIDWLQISTSNVPKFTMNNFGFTEEEDLVVLEDSLFADLRGQKIKPSYTKHQFLEVPEGAKVLSRYIKDGAPRDILFTQGENQIVFVNGLIGAIGEPGYLEKLLHNWGEVAPRKAVSGENIRGTVLESGDTKIILAYNYDIRERQKVNFKIDTEGKPISQVRLLSRDGEMYKNLNYRQTADSITFSDTLQYYGVYEVVLSSVKVSVPKLVIHPGERKTIKLELTNLRNQKVQGTIRLKAVIPTIVCKSTTFVIPPRGECTVNLNLQAKETIDWGRKTVLLEIKVGGNRSVSLYELVVEKNPELVVVNKLLDFRNPALEIKNVQNPFISNAAASKVEVEIDGSKVRFGEIRGTEVVSKNLPIKVPSVKAAKIIEKKLKISYPLWGKKYTQEETVMVALYPDEFAKMPEAIAPVLVFNPYQRHMENEVVTIELQGWLFEKMEEALRRSSGASGTYTVYMKDQKGTVIPAQLVFPRELSFLATVPPKSCLLLYLCVGPAKVQTDLRLERHENFIEVRNSHLKVSFDPSKGGTVNSLISPRTDSDYAANSFGINYGQFSKSDPLRPAHNAAEYIVEKKTRQEDKPGKVTILTSGPLRAILQVDWSDENVKATERYEFFAYQDKFKISTEVEPTNLRQAEEIVALDARFIPHKLTKIFPSFTGMPEYFNQPNPHFGWRQNPLVLDYITLMSPPNFEESISFIVLKKEGIDKLRQGFWPERRPDAGECRYAEVEFICNKPRPIHLETIVMFHAGHQIVAKQSVAELQTPPLIVLPQVERWEEAKVVPKPKAPPATPETWWSPYWHYRMPIKVSEDKYERLDEIVSLKVDFGDLLKKSGLSEEFDVNSIRVLEYYHTDILKETPSKFELSEGEKAAGTLYWLLSGKTLPDRKRFYFLYFDTVPNGPKGPSSWQVAPLGEKLLNPSIEEGGKYWELGGVDAKWYTKEAHSGKGCVKLELRETTPGAHSFMGNTTLRAIPDARYKLSFWAKVLWGTGFVRTNFYQGPQYDFTQIPVDLISDGKWHKYEVEVPTGYFPPHIQLMFRIWAIEKPQITLIDDIHLELVSPPEARLPGLGIEMGGLQGAPGL